MDKTPVTLLEQKHQDIIAKMSNLDATILAAKTAIVKAEESKSMLAGEVAHIEYCLNLLKKPNQILGEPIKFKSDGHAQPIRVILLNLFSEGESMTVAEVVKKAAPYVSTTPATINTTLFGMVKKGVLEKVSIGVYKKPQKGESPASTGLSGVTEFEQDSLV